MRYYVVALGEDDLARGDKTDSPREREAFVSERLTWDSPVAAVEVAITDLEAGLWGEQLERLGR